MGQNGTALAKSVFIHMKTSKLLAIGLTTLLAACAGPNLSSKGQLISCDTTSGTVANCTPTDNPTPTSGTCVDVDEDGDGDDHDSEAEDGDSSHESGAADTDDDDDGVADAQDNDDDNDGISDDDDCDEVKGGDDDDSDDNGGARTLTSPAYRPVVSSTIVR